METFVLKTFVQNQLLKTHKSTRFTFLTCQHIPVVSVHLPVEAECPFTSTGLHTTVSLVALKLDGHRTKAIILSPECSASRVEWSSGLASASA